MMPQNEENYDNSILQLLNKVDRRTIFFVGAGISIPSGLPNFSSLSRKAITKIGGDLILPEEYEIICTTLRPEVIFKIMVEEFNEESLSFLEMFEGYKPEDNHFFLADKLKQGHCVITTNGDHLIEDACTAEKVPFSVIYNNNDYLQFNENILKKIDDPFDIPGGFLFKLHGNLEPEKKGTARYSSFLVTVNNVGKRFDVNKTAVLKHFLEHFNLIFMGYSCLDDFSIFPIMVHTEGEGKVYWFKFKKGLLNERITDREKLIQTEYQDNETKNVNRFLSSRKSFERITGDSSQFIKEMVKPPITSGKSEKSSVSEGPKLPDFSKFCDSVDPISKLIFLGRLWEESPHIYSKDNSIKLFEQAESSVVRGDPKLGIVKLYLGRVYDKKVGKTAEKKVIEYYSSAFEIFKGDHNFLKAYESKLATANFKRRAMEDFTGAREILEEPLIKEYIAKIENADNEETSSFYSRYLNILGLTYMRSGKEFWPKCEPLFEKSVAIKERIGDIDGAAESLNAWGLFLQSHYGNDLSKLNSAIEKFNEAIDRRKALANNRGLYQNYRNLGLCYSNKLKYVNDDEKEDIFKLAEKCFIEGSDTLLKLVDNPPLEDKLEFDFRLSELYTNNAKNIGKAIQLLSQIQIIRKQKGDWHNLARTKNLLFICYNLSNNFDGSSMEGKEIIDIYKDVTSSDVKIAVLKKDVKKLDNAVEILDNIVRSRFLTNEVKKIAENLKNELKTL